MIVIAIIGILAAIALPAYAKYMARARFTEVVQATDGVKKQVELCFFAEGTGTFTSKGATITNTACTNGDSSASGDGWRLGKKGDYATSYVDNITVTNGTIVATSISSKNLNSATYTLVPTFGAADNGIIDWKHDKSATTDCSAMDLC